MLTVCSYIAEIWEISLTLMKFDILMKNNCPRSAAIYDINIEKLTFTSAVIQSCTTMSAFRFVLVLIQAG